jgi:LysR family hydrogen peroxide-inducible transcriptional activator
MARVRDTDTRRIYRSLASPKPTRRIVMVTNPYRFQSRLVKRFKKCLHQAART